MLDDLKKELSSIKVLTVLLSIAVGLYLLQFLFEFLRNFSDIILILVFGWLLSFILEPFVDVFSKYLKTPRIVSTILVFVLAGVFMSLTVLLFIPDVISQFQALEKIVPNYLQNSPPAFERGVNKFIDSLNNVIGYVPSVAQFLVNLVTILILSFYLVVEKKNINKKFFTILPKKWHESMHFFQRVVDQTFTSFVRIQIIWGLIGGVVTWLVLTAFGVNFAASTSLLAGILTAFPVIGPIIGVVPPVMVSLIDQPSKVLLIFVIIFGIQQIIFNVFGPKIIGRAFQISPVIVMLSLLIGIKVAGFTGAVFAIPVASIAMIVGREFYGYYFKEKED